MELFTPRSRTIMQLFMDTDSLYRIPKYQRPYKWVDDQVEQLWDDIYTSYESNVKNYFLGSIITAVPEQGSKRFDVVDGQQRLTTLMILFCVLRDLFPKLNIENDGAITKEHINNTIFSFGSERLILLTDVQHSADFKKYIIEDGCSLTHQKPKKYELKNDEEPKFKFQNTAYIVKNKLENIGEKEVENFVEYLFNQVSIIRIDCIDRGFAIKLFQVLNDRGMDLTASDLIKSFLLEQIEKKHSNNPNKEKNDFEKKKEDEDEFITEWRRLENILSDTADDSMNDMFTLYLYYLIARNPKKSLSDELQDIFQKQDPNDTIKDFSEFVVTYKKEIWEKDDKVLYSFWYLRWTIYWKSVLLTALHTNYPYYEELKNELRRFYYLNWIAGKTLSNIKQVSFNIIAWVKEKKHINYIKTVLDNKLEKDDVIGEFKKSINDYDVYHTAWIKPLLVMVEYSITDDSKLNFIYLDNSIHAEHILPLEWNKIKEWKITFSDDDARKYLNSFGNLTLLSGSKNIAASNNSYSTKVKIYKGKGKYDDNDTGITAFDLTKNIMEEYPEKWDKNSIEDRKEYLIEKVYKILNVR